MRYLLLLIYCSIASFTKSVRKAISSNLNGRTSRRLRVDHLQQKCPMNLSVHNARGTCRQSARGWSKSITFAPHIRRPVRLTICAHLHVNNSCKCCIVVLHLHWFDYLQQCKQAAAVASRAAQVMAWFHLQLLHAILLQFLQ